MNQRGLTVILCVLALAVTPAVAALSGSAKSGGPAPGPHQTRALAQPISPEDFEARWDDRADAAGASAELPQPVDEIRPGSKILIDIVGFGNTRCTASWIVQGDAGDYFIATAGHCVLPGEAAAPHEIKRSTHEDYQGANVIVCVANCYSEQTNADEAYVSLGDVLFAQYVDRDTDSIGLGYDLAFVEIPARHYDLVNTSLAHWEGPLTAGGSDLPAAGDLALQYGHGTALGDVWLTEGRTGVFDGDTRSRGEDCHHEGDGCTVAYVGAASGGDSGSPIAIGTHDTDEQGVVAEHAIAITTHISGFMYLSPLRANAVWGTHIQQATGITEEVTGHELSFVASNESLPLPAPIAPGDVDVDNPGTGDSLALVWSTPRSTLPLEGYGVHRSAGSSTFEDKMLVHEPGDPGLEDTGLAENTTYCYQIVAIDEQGQTSPPSSEACATAEPLGPPAPAVRADNPGLGGELTLAWSEPEHVRAISHYVVERSVDGASFETIATTESRVLADEGLDGSSTYAYRVQAVDDRGLASAWNTTEPIQPVQDEPEWRQAAHDAQGQAFTGATGAIGEPSPHITGLAGPVTAAPLVADLDDSGQPDVVAIVDAEQRGQQVHLQAHELEGDTLEERWSTPLPATLIVGLESTSGTARAAIADLDEDPAEEVVVYTNYRFGQAGESATEDGAVFVLDGETGGIEAVENGAVGFSTETAPRIGDVTPSPGEEIVILEDGPELTVLGFDGDELVVEATGTVGSGQTHAAPVLADIDPHRPGLEVALGTTDGDDEGGLFVCRPSAGTVDCQQLATVPSGVRGLATATLEPVLTPSLVAHGSATPGLNVRPTAPAGTNVSVETGALVNQPAIGPLGPDGRNAIVSGLADPRPADLANDGDLLAHGPTGDGFARLEHVERAGGIDEAADTVGQAVADIDGDGALDIVAVDTTGTVLAHSPAPEGSGQPLWSLDVEGSVDAPPSLADVDGDGTIEVLVASEDGRIAVIAATN